VRGMHEGVRGRVRGRAYSASDPQLLRWVHLAFTDAFLAAQQAVGRDLTARFGRAWPDAYVADWARSAEELGATDLPRSAAELADALAAHRPQLAPVPDALRAFLAAPPGLSAPERVFYRGLSGAAGQLVSPALADCAGVPGRGRGGAAQVAVARAQLTALRLALGDRSPSEQAARWRLGLGPAPDWAEEAAA
jgi:uncharacterized protein (DUF2236 family)